MRTWSTTIAAASAAAVGLLLAGCAAADDDVNTASEPGATAKAGATVEPGASVEPAADGPFDFTTTTVSGESFEGESLKHRDVVLWFWAPWCPTCKVEGRDQVAEAIAQMPDDVELVGIAGRSDDLAAMEEFLDWTGTGDAVHVTDMDGSIWEGFGVVLQPAFYFVNDDGQSRRAGSGMTTEDIMAEVEWLQSN